MSSPRRHRLNRLPAQIVIWAVLLVLGLGVPRLFVVCTGAHCASRIELAHAAGSCSAQQHACCAAHAGDDGSGDDGSGERLRAGHAPCVDTALGMAFGPLPKQAPVVPDAAPCFAPAAGPAAPSCHEPGPTERPPTTGPPRADARTALRACTLLLL